MGECRSGEWGGGGDDGFGLALPIQLFSGSTGEWKGSPAGALPENTDGQLELEYLRVGACGDFEFTVCGVARVAAVGMKSTVADFDSLHARLRLDIYLPQSYGL